MIYGLRIHRYLALALFGVMSTLNLVWKHPTFRRPKMTLDNVTQGTFKDICCLGNIKGCVVVENVLTSLSTG